MKALSIRQPWAWLIIHGGKDVENRTWHTKHRGALPGACVQEHDQRGILRRPGVRHARRADQGASRLPIVGRDAAGVVRWNYRICRAGRFRRSQPVALVHGREGVCVARSKAAGVHAIQGASSVLRSHDGAGTMKPTNRFYAGSPPDPGDRSPLIRCKCRRLNTLQGAIK